MTKSATTSTLDVEKFDRNDTSRASKISVGKIESKISSEMADLTKFLPAYLQPIQPVPENLESTDLHNDSKRIAYDINKTNIEMDIIENNIKNFTILDNNLEMQNLSLEIQNVQIMLLLEDKLKAKQQDIAMCEKMKVDDDKIVEDLSKNFIRRSKL